MAQQGGRSRGVESGSLENHAQGIGKAFSKMRFGVLMDGEPVHQHPKFYFPALRQGLGFRMRSQAAAFSEAGLVNTLKGLKMTHNSNKPFV